MTVVNLGLICREKYNQMWHINDSIPIWVWLHNLWLHRWAFFTVDEHFSLLMSNLDTEIKDYGTSLETRTYITQRCLPITVSLTSTVSCIRVDENWIRPIDRLPWGRWWTEFFGVFFGLNMKRWITLISLLQQACRDAAYPLHLYSSQGWWIGGKEHSFSLVTGCPHARTLPVFCKDVKTWEQECVLSFMSFLHTGASGYNLHIAFVGISVFICRF